MNRFAFSNPEYPEREIARIQRELDGLKSVVGGGTATVRHVTSEADVRAVLRARRNRENIFGKELFADPAWDILLELYASELGQHRISTTELAVAAGIPLTTALRWISKLESDRIVTREDDPLDGRRVWIALAETAISLMKRYFDERAANATFA